MVSDVITVKSDGTGMKEALAQVEAAAAFRSLSDKEMLRLRLLAEEMTGMLCGITGELTADFRIESEDKKFRLYLSADTVMNPEKREKLLSVSTSGKNAAAKGIMGKIREFFSSTYDPNYLDPTFYSMGMLAGGDPDTAATICWSLNRYRSEIAKQTAGSEWDELETSIVGKLADEVKVGITGNRVELVIYKSF
ncbi:MAG: hypothetical protein IJS65_06540 [Clostridia bacterium]|nr:hypothetical protein [Clostridia bacterium]